MKKIKNQGLLTITFDDSAAYERVRDDLISYNKLKAKNSYLFQRYFNKSKITSLKCSIENSVFIEDNRLDKFVALLELSNINILESKILIQDLIQKMETHDFKDVNFQSAHLDSGMCFTLENGYTDSNKLDMLSQFSQENETYFNILSNFDISYKWNDSINLWLPYFKEKLIKI